MDEMHAALGGDGPGQQRLAGAGGPYRSTPFGARMPSRSNTRACFNGSSTIYARGRLRAPGRRCLRTTRPAARGRLLAFDDAEIGAGPITTGPAGMVRTT